MYRPSYLQSGDKVYITSTARRITTEELTPFITWISSHGLVPVIGSTIGLEEDQYAGTDDERAADFQLAIDNPEIKAIWFARGGYGSIRLFDLIRWDHFIDHPKWLLGFSDVTVWHNLVNQFYGIQTIHALMPLTLTTNTKESIQATLDMIRGLKSSIEFDKSDSNKGNSAIEGEIIGGNLSILYSLLGTKAGFNTNGKILFIEEIDEYLYHIDRMMISLKFSGKLSGLKGLLVGGFTDIKDNTIPFGKTVQEIILEHTKEFTFPIWFDFPSGHIANNMPIRMGAQVRLSSSASHSRLDYIDQSIV